MIKLPHLRGWFWVQNLNIAGSCISRDDDSFPRHLHAAGAAADGSVSPEEKHGNAGACQAVVALTGITHLALGGRDDDMAMATQCESYIVPPEELAYLSSLTNLQELVMNQNTLEGLTAAERLTGVVGYLASLTSLKSLALNGRSLAEEHEAGLLEGLKLQGFLVKGLQVSLCVLSGLNSSDHSASDDRSELSSNDSEGMSPGPHRSDGEFEGNCKNQDEFGGFWSDGLFE